LKKATLDKVVLKQKVSECHFNL